jgi:hypothetical protein
VLKIFFAKADGSVSPVFGKHGQTVGPADDGAGIIHEAGAVFQQGTGAERIGMPGFVLNALLQAGRHLLQRHGHRYGFNRVNRKVNPTTVAGTSLCTGNVVRVPADDPVTAPIEFGDQLLIFFEGLQNNSGFTPARLCRNSKKRLISARHDKRAIFAVLLIATQPPALK